ncbi:NADPH:quinone reductase [Shimia ponticola]|uniref:NADPH:quinone reductase n=1 Tax=Shimia ponticola TaxID=2582893 RepID=UPI0011BDFB7B|nr:NADPH:quinone reductase [Shimia ponticola]
MKAAFYEGFGPAQEVLRIGDVATPDPGPGEVLVRLRASGVNPSDVKLRAGARPGAVMAYPRVIPHSDGAGEIAAVGEGVDRAVGARVWVWNANWQRAFGTSADYVCLPSEQVVELPDGVSFAAGACLGIPAMTAAYALDGVIAGQTVLVTGGAGAVGRYACQMAALMGARVITTVSSKDKAAHSGCEEWINYREADVSAAVMDMTNGDGIDRIVDVDFAANQDVAVACLRPGGTVSSYASASVVTPELQFYPLMFKDITLRMLIVYQLTGTRRAPVQERLQGWLRDGALSHAPVTSGGLEAIAAAHDLVAAGDKLGTVVLEV